MSRPYTFTVEAETDLLAIWFETEDRWGEAQADRYQDELHDGCQRIADGIAATRPVEGMAEIRFYHSGTAITITSRCRRCRLGGFLALSDHIDLQVFAGVM